MVEYDEEIVFPKADGSIGMLKNAIRILPRCFEFIKVGSLPIFMITLSFFHFLSFI